MLRAMTRVWLVGACVLAIACGPSIAVETMGDDESEASTDAGGDTSSGSSDTGSDPVSTTLPGTTGPRLDVGGPDGRIDGPYLLALAAVIDPGHPFQWVAHTRMSGGFVDLELQPLTLDIGGTVAPRLPFGEPLVYSDIPVVGGCFTLDMGMVTIPGATNPITGSDLQAIVVLDGCFDGVDYCGTVSGRVSSPLELDLAGSTFAAIATDPQMLPVDFPTSC
jgi:hypothetical protein